MTDDRVPRKDPLDRDVELTAPIIDVQEKEGHPSGGDTD
jgi:hypothetical protein